jgi:hypothetical protein
MQEAAVEVDEEVYEIVTGKTSAVWDVMLVYRDATGPREKMAVCMYCVKQLSFDKNTTNMWQHVASCKKMPVAVRERVQAAKAPPKRWAGHWVHPPESPMRFHSICSTSPLCFAGRARLPMVL